MGSKNMVSTDLDGNFEINASIGNWISFYHKNYEVVKIYIDSSFSFDKTLEVKLAEKTIRIEEVVVKKTVPIFGKISTDMPVAPNNKPNVQFPDGSIPNGINFVAIGKMIIGLFKKDKSKIKSKPIVDFKNFTSQNYNSEFLTKSLKLKPEEIESFLDFCNFDPNSKKAVEDSDKLVLLEFLITKSEEFKKVYGKE